MWQKRWGQMRKISVRGFKSEGMIDGNDSVFVCCLTLIGNYPCFRKLKMH